jgi:hypothetical protein
MKQVLDLVKCVPVMSGSPRNELGELGTDNRLIQWAARVSIPAPWDSSRKVRRRPSLSL